MTRGVEEPSAWTPPKTEDVESPRLKGDEKAQISQFITGPFVGGAWEKIGQPPGLSGEVLPQKMDSRLGRMRAVVHRDEPTFVAIAPAPGQDLYGSQIAAPSRGLT